MSKYPKSPYKETKCYYWEWVAVYDRYEKVFVPSYCESCGQQDGGYWDEVGVNIIRYDLKKFKKDTFYLMGKAMEKILLPSIEKNIRSSSYLFNFFNSKKQ